MGIAKQKRMGKKCFISYFCKTNYIIGIITILILVFYHNLVLNVSQIENTYTVTKNMIWFLSYKDVNTVNVLSLMDFSKRVYHRVL